MKKRFIKGMAGQISFDYFESMHKRVVLFNTFWGMDKPTVMMPPNFIVTGPLLKEPTALLEQF